VVSENGTYDGTSYLSLNGNNVHHHVSFIFLFDLIPGKSAEMDQLKCLLIYHSSI